MSASKIWQRMLSIHAEQQFSIGVVNNVMQPVVVTNTLKNVPEKAHLQLGSGRVSRHLPAGHVLVHGRAQELT